MKPIGWLTIHSGPLGSGKTTESLRQLEEPGVEPFTILAGHGEPGSIRVLKKELYAGKNVVYETTLTPDKLGPELLELANTIEIFRRNDDQ